MGFFDPKNPGVGYNVIVFAVESAVMNLVWFAAYLGPTMSDFFSMFVTIWFPWIVNMFALIWWPVLWSNGIYMMLCKKLIWDYDYANDNGNFLFIENPYLVYHDEYDF